MSHSYSRILFLIKMLVSQIPMTKSDLQRMLLLLIYLRVSRTSFLNYLC